MASPPQPRGDRSASADGAIAGTAPEHALASAAPEGLEFTNSQAMGAAFVLDGLWRQLGIDMILGRLRRGRRIDAAVERVLFALVANRAISPSSKLAATTWAADRVHIHGPS